MKLFRLVFTVIVLVSLVLGAAAESAPVTRETVIEMEGAQETITQTLYESPMGYKLWYDAKMFAYAAPGEGNDVDGFVPVSPEAVPGVGLYINYSAQPDYTLDMARVDVIKSLEENGYTVTELDAKLLFPSVQAYGFHAVKGVNALDKYIVAAKTGEFYLTMEYPQETAEGFGARLQLMAATFEPVAE